MDDHSKDMSYEDFTRYVIGDDVYNDIVSTTKDIYPIRKLEVRKSMLLEIGQQSETTIPETAPEETAPEQVS